ncbi:hypothetical protein PHLGIDRAFT_124066 [Phlebiopsis gigantea 11061_1 CR5-6]|uniref:RRM domain-containing protein n=1 Tax=Phlebiopsis gigantea (strain 11061_1 CR5-6) TaxID=745531 RepID=A0A0C3SE91_PHLG1|nr:hypothetical protein PHLGIDRAFT_124066 [Phlebiopsis gigantea 11061_1 CR5-6]
MSAPAKLTKKQKKALAFRDRKGKDKAKATDDQEENDVPVMEDQDAAAAEVEDSAMGHAQTDKHQDRSPAQVVEGKKRKRDAGEAAEHGGGKGKPKKRKKDSEQAETVVSGNGDAGQEVSKTKAKSKPQRFILFVGNLKYSTTKEAVQAHFAQCEPPPTVRLMTPKPAATGKLTAKSKGFAFLEFSEKSGLQQALKLHQSQLESRMINVELTAGGGGKSDARLAKVRERNKELHEQRKKKLEKNKKRAEGGSNVQDLERPQRYSATSGVVQAPSKKRTWSVPEETDVKPEKKRGLKKRPKALGTGVNAIPVG